MFRFRKLVTSLCTEEIERISSDYCKDKTSKHLIEKLRSNRISEDSGQMIVTELLQRLCQAVDLDKDKV